MTDTILPHELPSVLDGRSQAKILSLDCFDTLLWRDTHAPAGVFEALPELTTAQRMRGESRARKAASVARGSSEVTIGEIYAHAMPNACDAQRGKAIAAELAAETAHCFAFAPTVELMRTAKAAGMRIVIVSDTYLDKRQLRGLIVAGAGRDVADMIDSIFCSSTIGLSKSQGMFGPVLKALKCKRTDILHIGDNRLADYDGARALGIPALHLQQFSQETRQRLRFEESIAAMIAPDKRTPQPHRAALSLGEPSQGDPASMLGFSVLGPVFNAYRSWLEGEAARLEAAHEGQVHWLFLMRDGHLPRAVHALRHPDDPGHAIELSRFAATAASLTSNQAIQQHVEQEFGLNPATLARQLLFTDSEIDKLVDGDFEQSSLRLLAETRKGARRKIIRSRARAYAARLVAHIVREVGPKRGDVLMLVDLGYNGSAQNHVDALLREELGVHVAGRYLLMRETDAPGLDKAGMIGPDTCDARTLEALCANVAVIEQLSTTALGSVVDYTEEGQPLRHYSVLKSCQSEVRDQVQAGCLEFCRMAGDPVLRPQDENAARNWREGAIAALARFMYLPLPQELAVLEDFEHDVNTGSDRMVPLFDTVEAREGMRRRGLFYMKGAQRMYLPAELAGEDLATRLSLFAHKRFGLGFTYEDDAPGAPEFPVIHIDGPQASQSNVTAQPTHDGYFAMRVPIGAGRYSIAVQFGAKLEWVQVESVTAAPVSSLKDGDVQPVPLAPLLDDMEQTAPHLFHCQSETGLMLINPPRLENCDAGQDQLMVEIVFRPLVERRSGAAATDAQPIRQEVAA